MENKKRKLVALANIIAINENDEKSKKAMNKTEETSTDSDEKFPSTSSDPVRVQKFHEKSFPIDISNFHPQHEEPAMKIMRSDLTDPNLVTDNQYKMIKRELAQKRTALKNVPRFRLKLFGEKASLLTKERFRQVCRAGFLNLCAAAR